MKVEIVYLEDVNKKLEFHLFGVDLDNGVESPTSLKRVESATRLRTNISSAMGKRCYLQSTVHSNAVPS